jgi:hypothetical protein
MATRSTINLKLPDGRYRHIYCHWDGYLEHVGIILLKNYNTIDKINELMDHGDVSSLNDTIEKTEFYKDRGEDDSDARILDYHDVDFEEYNYFFTNNKWYYHPWNSRTIMPLTKKLIYFGE